MDDLAAFLGDKPAIARQTGYEVGYAGATTSTLNPRRNSRMFLQEHLRFVTFSDRFFGFLAGQPTMLCLQHRAIGAIGR